MRRGGDSRHVMRLGPVDKQKRTSIGQTRFEGGGRLSMSETQFPSSMVVEYGTSPDRKSEHFLSPWKPTYIAARIPKCQDKQWTQSLLSHRAWTDLPLSQVTQDKVTCDQAPANEDIDGPRPLTPTRVIPNPTQPQLSASGLAVEMISRQSLNPCLRRQRRKQPPTT